jgi:hypothetical protein
MSTERPGFCRWHRSHFCPCVRPDLYANGIKETRTLRRVDNLPRSQRAWDEAEQRQREKSTPKEDR